MTVRLISFTFAKTMVNKPTLKLQKTSTMTNKILDLIASDKIEEAAILFEQVMNSSSKLYEVLQQRGRLSDLNRILSLGVLNPDQYLNEKNKIRWSMLELVKELEEIQANDEEIARDIDSLSSKSVTIIQRHSGIGDNIGGDYISGNKLTK